MNMTFCPFQSQVTIYLHVQLAIPLPDDGCPVNELQDAYDNHSLSLPDKVMIEQGGH